MRKTVWQAMVLALALVAGLLLPAAPAKAAPEAMPSCHQLSEKAASPACQCDLLRCCAAMSPAPLPAFTKMPGFAPLRQAVPDAHPGYATTATPPPRSA